MAYQSYSLSVKDFESVLERVRMNYDLYGPTVQDGAIVYDSIESISDLPQGWEDEQAPGHYRIGKSDSPQFFGHVVGPHSWKKYLFPSREQLWSIDKVTGKVEVTPEPERPMAFLGVRGCELAAISVQDKVFSQGTRPDGFYHRRRDGLFLIAVNCTVSSASCFCTSMKTGPNCQGSFDVQITEYMEKDSHKLIMEIHSDRARELLSPLNLKPASNTEFDNGKNAVETNARGMKRQFTTEGVKEALQQNLEHPRWDEVAERCLDCANCTMVCPTCFCSTTVDTTDLKGDHAERWREWDSCFNLDFSYIHGGEIRKSTRSRYRQWLTHKLANWWDQFGTSGCVGCGRCISWCPVGIDLTEEATAIRENQND